MGRREPPFIRSLRRQLRHGVLSVRILEILGDGPTYGYALLERLSTGPGGGDSVGPSVLYPTLARLSSHGLVRSFHGQTSLGPIRKYYALTTQGRAALPLARELMAQLRPERDRTPENRALPALVLLSSPEAAAWP